MDREKNLKKEPKGNVFDQAKDVNMQQQECSQSKDIENVSIDLLKDMDRLKQEILDREDKILRLTAELENTRNRLTREIDQVRSVAISNFAVGVCEIADNMARAKECMKGEDSKSNSILRGVEMVIASMDQLLIQHGINKIASSDHKFDPNLHEAMGEEATDKVSVGYIVRELVAGYTINGRLLRPAKVIIAKQLDK